MAGEDSKRRQALEDIRSLRDQGWYWSNTTHGLLLSPCDPDVHLWHDGATDELVTHLRGPGPHVRGCFAVDLCLGLS